MTDPSGRPRQLKFIYGFDQRRAQSQRETIARLRASDSSRPGVDGSGGLWPGPVGPDHRSTLQDSAGSLARMSGGGTSRDPLGGAVSSPGRDGRGPGHLVPGDRSVPPCPDSTATGARWGLVSVADFGLVPLLWLPARRSMAQINPRYAAPELFTWHVHRSADQYSLASDHSRARHRCAAEGGRTVARRVDLCRSVSWAGRPDGCGGRGAGPGFGGRPRSTVPQLRGFRRSPAAAVSEQRSAVSGQRSEVSLTPNGSGSEVYRVALLCLSGVTRRSNHAGRRTRHSLPDPS